jgi:hypothetical protein
MPTSILKRPRNEDNLGRRPAKKIRKRQFQYHSSSSEDEDEPADFAAINLQDSDEETTKTAQRKLDTEAERFEDAPLSEDSEEEEGDEPEVDGAESDITGASSGSESEASTNAGTKGKKRKRNDPNAFATSISKILSSKLTTSKRADPVLSRSKDASTASKELADSRLEARAKHKLRLERREALDRGRVKDVLGLQNEGVSTQDIMETERKLKKTAQRGVVKLFNAVREAQKRGEDAKREALKKGVVGMDKREEKVSEMSKKGFLELIASGGARKSNVAAIEA